MFSSIRIGAKKKTNISYFSMATYFSNFFAVYLQIDSIIEESELFKYYTELSFFKLFVIAHGIRLDIMYFSLTKLLFKKLIFYVAHTVHGAKHYLIALNVKYLCFSMTNTSITLNGQWYKEVIVRAPRCLPLLFCGCVGSPLHTQRY